MTPPKRKQKLLEMNAKLIPENAKKKKKKKKAHRIRFILLLFELRIHIKDFSQMTFDNINE